MIEQSNMSYTNKDFNSIYLELLECAKQLSYKWDPTVSNESDPGVVLLKLAAIIGDKDNYNIDKNILELMPASVTQIPAARQIFDQCGYTMHHYIAAEGDIQVVWEDSENTITEITLPKFTAVTNKDSTIVYTTVQDATLLNGQQTFIPVIEGSAVNYTVNNDPLIQLSNLDSNNRIYFTEYNVAENGIFVTNQSGADFWESVENLSIQPQKTKCFKFGLSLDGNSCYIEFPQDIPELIEGGLNITYITTSGSLGNIKQKELKNLFSGELKIALDQDKGAKNNEIKLNSDNLAIVNNFPILTGKDPQTIQEAYRSYEKIKGTFDTLVTTRDYTNYIILNNIVSNGFVCDRTNDPNYSYKILKTDSVGSILDTCVVEDNERHDEMLPYELCVYGLTYVPEVKSSEDYIKSFEFDLSVVDSLNKNTNEEFSSIKSIQHDIKEYEDKQILLIKNKYRIHTNIIPRYRLTPVEIMSVQENVRVALYKSLNSKMLNFGEEPSYNLIYDALQTSDSRIKAVTLEYPTYETYVVYIDKNENKVKELRIDVDPNYKVTDDTKDLINKFRAIIFAKNVLAGVTPLYDFEKSYTRSVTQSNTQEISDINYIIPKTKIVPEEQSNSTFNYQVRDNEQIVLMSPNYIEQTNYSSYVKLVYKLNNDNSIPSNSKYALRKGDYIAFFWKESDTDTDYKYVKYDDESEIIISPTFEMTPQVGVSEVLDTYVDEGLKAGTGYTTSSITTEVANMTSEKNGQVLSGTRVIKIYKKHSVTINPSETNNSSTLAYWILNKVNNNNEYELFPELDGEKSYILGSGEYFFYTNTKKTMFYILGEGTTITVSGKLTKPLSCSSGISYQDIMTQGITCLDNFWEVLPNGLDTTVSESTMIILGPSTKLSYSPDNQTMISVILSNTTDHIPDNVDMKHNNIDVTSIDLDTHTLELEDGTTISFENNPITVSCSMDNYFALKNAGVNVSPDISISSTTWLPLSGTLRYTDSNNVTTTLPKIDSETDCWKATAILSVDCGPEKHQKLEKNQSIELFNDDTKVHTLFDSEIILSSTDILKSGGLNGDEKIDVTYFADYSLNSKTSLKILSFTNADYPKEFSFVKTFDSDEKLVELTFSQPKGNYLLHISSDESTSPLTIQLATSYDNKWSEVPLLSGDEDESVTTRSLTYKLKLDTDLDTAVDYKLRITPTKSTKLINYSIQPLVKYITDTLDNLGDAFEQTVLDTIKYLDKKSEFNYSIVPELPIVNPLVGSTFWNKSHVYNRYTIGQWTENNYDINVINNIK